MKKLLFIILVIISLFSIGNFISSIYTLWHKKDLLIIAKRQLQMEEDENKRLKQDLSRVNSQEFVEQEARNKLFLIKPGESTVVIPTIALRNIEEKKSIKKVQKSNWEQWRELFF